MFARECNQQCEIWLAYLYFSARKCCSHKCCNTQQSPIYLYLKNPFAFLLFPTNQYLMLLAYTKVVSPNAMINSHLHQCQQLLYHRLLIIKKKVKEIKLGKKEIFAHAPYRITDLPLTTPRCYRGRRQQHITYNNTVANVPPACCWCYFFLTLYCQQKPQMFAALAFCQQFSSVCLLSCL